MGCIQGKKTVKISHLNPSFTKKGKNNVEIHNSKNEITNDNIEQRNELENKVSKNDKTETCQNSNQIIKVKNSSRDIKSKSSKSSSESEKDSEKVEIFKLTSNLNVVNKELKFEDKYVIIKENINNESFFPTYKIKLKNNILSKEEFRSMVKIEKEIFGTMVSDKKIAEEVSTLSKLDSNYIIKVYECYISDKRYYLITDYCEYKSLENQLKEGNKYNEDQIRYVIIQVLKAIKYFNSKNFLHSEINPEKIIIYNTTNDSYGEELYNIKLQTFFCPPNKNSYSSFCYSAPEVLEQKYSATCDIWSIGIIIFQMFFGDMEVRYKNDFDEYIKKIISIYSDCQSLSKELKDLLNRIFNLNPLKRITLEGCLEHPWIKIKTSVTPNSTNEFDSKTNNNTNIKLLSPIKNDRKDKCHNNEDSSILSSEQKMENESVDKLMINKNKNEFGINEIINESKKINQRKSKMMNLLTNISADRNLEILRKNRFHPLIEHTIDYIKYYLSITYNKKNEIAKITKIFKELDTQNNNYLLYSKVYFACISYKDNKNISLDSFSGYNLNNINNKKFRLEEFIKILINEKTKYIHNNLKNSLEGIIQPNVDEIIKIYKEQEPIYEYKKYLAYIKDFVKFIEEREDKKNYYFNEFKTIIDNTIDKIYQKNIYNNSTINQELRRAKTKKIMTHKFHKSKSKLKRSKTHMNPHSKNKSGELEKTFFSPDNFLKLTQNEI